MPGFCFNGGTNRYSSLSFSSHHWGRTLVPYQHYSPVHAFLAPSLLFFCPFLRNHNTTLHFYYVILSPMVAICSQCLSFVYMKMILYCTTISSQETIHIACRLRQKPNHSIN